MSNVVPLSGGTFPGDAKPNEALVRNLRTLLEEAQAGRLQSFIGTGFRSDGLRYSVWNDFHPNAYEMLGALTVMQAEFVRKHALDE